MAISVDGITSGIDTSSLISELSTAYGAPKDLIEAEVADYEALQSAMSELSGLLGEVSSALESIEDVEDFRSFSVAYPETDALIASGAFWYEYSRPVTDTRISATVIRNNWGSCQRMFTRSPLFTRRSRRPATTNAAAATIIPAIIRHGARVLTPRRSSAG